MRNLFVLFLYIVIYLYLLKYLQFNRVILIIILLVIFVYTIIENKLNVYCKIKFKKFYIFKKDMFLSLGVCFDANPWLMLIGAWVSLG